MENTDKNLSLINVAKEPGVADLPLKARGAFAKAIIAERKGNHDEAEKQLEKAIADEVEA
jgi:hypothetical protein